MTTTYWRADLPGGGERTAPSSGPGTGAAASVGRRVVESVRGLARACREAQA